MIIVSQFKNRTTESLEFEIIERKTAKNEIIPKEAYQKFKKIVQKRDDDNILSLKDMKGLGEFLGKELIRNVYMVVEVKSGRNFGTYTTREKARKSIQQMLQKIEKNQIYQMPEDTQLGIIMF